MNNHRQVTPKDSDRIWESVRQEIMARERATLARHKAITAWAIILAVAAAAGLVAVNLMGAGR